MRGRPILVRRARWHEAALLSELSLRSKAVWGYDAGFMARCRAALTLTPASIAAAPHYVAQSAHGTVLGLYALQPETDGLGIDLFFVAPEAIGTGIGRRLWQHAVGVARRLGYPALIVVSDPNAEGFYRRMGARPAGARESEIVPGRLLPVLRFDLVAPTNLRHPARQS